MFLHYCLHTLPAFCMSLTLSALGDERKKDRTERNEKQRQHPHTESVLHTSYPLIRLRPHKRPLSVKAMRDLHRYLSHLFMSSLSLEIKLFFFCGLYASKIFEIWEKQNEKKFTPKKIKLIKGLMVFKTKGWKCIWVINGEGDPMWMWQSGTL